MYRRLYNPLVWLFLTISCSTSIRAEVNAQYIRLTDYVNQHPEQIKIMDRFSTLVREPASPLKLSNTRTVKLAIIYPGEQTSDYWRRSVSTIEKRLTESNVAYELKTFFSRPGIDIELQSKQLSKAIDWKPDYLVFTLDALRHQAMIERLLLRGTPKLILQNITTPLSRWSEVRPFMYTGFDHEHGSYLLAEEMLAQEPTGKYSMLYFAPGYVSQMRGDTFVSHTAEYSDLQKVSSYYTKGDRDIAFEATLAALEADPDLNMIFACSTDIALGAADALKQNNKLDQVLINGWGGGDSEIAALKKNEIDLTVMRMNDDSSVAIAEAIKLDLDNMEDQVPHVYSGDIVLLNHQADASRIEQLEQRAFRYSGLK